MLRLLVCGLLAVALCSIGASAAPAAERADSSVFGGLGTWVDIYDGSVYAAPERSAQRIAARDVRTVWVETANYGASATSSIRYSSAGWSTRSTPAGVRVVAWYLPGHVKPALDQRRSLAMLAFRTPTGGSFDGVALDIESTKLRNVALRSQPSGRARAAGCARQAGDTPLAIVPFNPRGLERRPTTWPGFPWARARRRAPTPSRRWCTRAAR